MTTFIVKNSILKNAFYAFLSLIFVGLGIYFLLADKLLIGWALTIFFGLVLSVTIYRFFNSHPRIIIDDFGIYDSKLGIGEIEWEDIDNIYLNSHFGKNNISLVLNDTAKYLRRISNHRSKVFQINSESGLETINLNLRGTDKKAQEVFEVLINQLKINRIKSLRKLGGKKLFC